MDNYEFINTALGIANDIPTKYDGTYPSNNVNLLARLANDEYGAFNNEWVIYLRKDLSRKY